MEEGNVADGCPPEEEMRKRRRLKIQGEELPFDPKLVKLRPLLRREKEKRRIKDEIKVERRKRDKVDKVGGISSRILPVYICRRQACECMLLRSSNF